MMEYAIGKHELEDWILAETVFSPDQLGKTEAIMVLGNGYMGLRSAAEEAYIKETRNLFVNGTFNKAFENEVTELPNAADVTHLDIRVDGERFNLEFGNTWNYIKQLNLRTAELTRTFDWESPKGKKLHFCFKRFVSLANKHVIAMKMEVTSLSGDVTFTFDSGIDAQKTNSGVQHFLEGERRILDGKIIQLSQTTNESKVDIIHNTTHKIFLNGEDAADAGDMDMARRKAWMRYEFHLKPNDQLVMEKLSTVHTSRDQDIGQDLYSLIRLREHSLNELKNHADHGYDILLKDHQEAWQKNVWHTSNLEVSSKDSTDQLALRFSLYHLTAMTPAHDARMGIGAKALSGEGYKGHSFWDTEIFILPFFTFSNPEAAKSLLTYRYYGLAGARQKAADNGYAGAMYPWEMAWPTDGEVTPVWGDIDIVTGEQTKIWSGFIEQHISADIAFAVYQYESVTGDMEFLQNYGFEIVFETAKFWASRLEWNEDRRNYQITDVIGPDEYKEHVNNNAFTNYMAYFNLKLAMRYAEELAERNPGLLESFKLGSAVENWREKAEGLYLPDPRKEDGVIPQDDTYLQLPEIDLAKYKNQSKVRTIYRDYSPEQINGFQVTKQADTLLLFYLLEQTFLIEDSRISESVKRSNFHYYEARTLHDSSLSLATHAIAANDLGETELAYSLFKEACNIDMGPQMDTSDGGVHAAAIGGIWKSAVFGFGGVRLTNGMLKINPRLPKKWEFLKFSIFWQGIPVMVEATHESLKVSVNGGGRVAFESAGKLHETDCSIEISLKTVNASGSEKTIVIK